MQPPFAAFHHHATLEPSPTPSRLARTYTYLIGVAGIGTGPAQEAARRGKEGEARRNMPPQRAGQDSGVGGGYSPQDLRHACVRSVAA